MHGAAPASRSAPPPPTGGGSPLALGAVLRHSCTPCTHLSLTFLLHKQRQLCDPTAPGAPERLQEQLVGESGVSRGSPQLASPASTHTFELTKPLSFRPQCCREQPLSGEASLPPHSLHPLPPRTRANQAYGQGTEGREPCGEKLGAPQREGLVPEGPGQLSFSPSPETQREYYHLWWSLHPTMVTPRPMGTHPLDKQPNQTLWAHGAPGY